MASSQTIRDILNDLYKFYDKKLSPAQQSFYETNLSPLDDDLLCKAIIELKRVELRFPPVAVIEKYYLAEQEAAWRQKKQRSPGMADFDRAIARLPNENLQKLFDGIGKMPKREWLQFGLEARIFSPVDVENIRESWRAMGASETEWKTKFLG